MKLYTAADFFGAVRVFRAFRHDGGFSGRGKRRRRQCEGTGGWRVCLHRGRAIRTLMVSQPKRIPTLERRFAPGDAGCKIARIDGMTQGPLAPRSGRCLPRICRHGPPTAMGVPGGESSRNTTCRSQRVCVICCFDVNRLIGISIRDENLKRPAVARLWARWRCLSII